MTFEAALTYELDTITALNHRIFALTKPEDPFDLTQPYCIIVTSEGLRDKSLDGYLDSKQVSGEVNIIAKTYGAMKAISASAVDVLIDMESRTVGGTNGIYIDELTYREPVELWEDEPKLYRCVIEFTAYFDKEVD